MKKVLIVDYESEIRVSISEVLEVEGYSVRSVSTTERAWEQFQKWKPDLILLDIMLPGDLKDFVNKLSQIEYNVKVLYLSVVQKSEAEKRGLTTLSEKICGYIEKPFSLNTLLTQVDKAFSS